MAWHHLPANVGKRRNHESYRYRSGPAVGYRCPGKLPLLHLHDQWENVLLLGVLLRQWCIPYVQHDLQLKTIVNITLIQEGDQITVRSDSLGQDEEVLSLGLQILSYLMMLENANPDRLSISMPTLSARAQ